MNRCQRFQPGWLITATLVAVAVVYLAFLWLPGQRSIATMRWQAKAMRQAAAQAPAHQAALVECRRKLRAAERIVAHWKLSAPDPDEPTSYHAAIDRAAQQAKLDIVRFDPLPPVVHAKIHEIPLALDCEGKFDEVCEFLRKLEQLPPTIWVESVKIDHTGGPEQNARCKLLVVGFGDRP